MESLGIPGLNAGLNLVVGILVKILFGLITILALLMSRQTVLMDKVVNIPVGGFLKSLTMLFFFLCLLMTAAVVLLV